MPPNLCKLGMLNKIDIGKYFQLCELMYISASAMVLEETMIGHSIEVRKVLFNQLFMVQGLYSTIAETWSWFSAGVSISCKCRELVVDICNCSGRSRGQKSIEQDNLTVLQDGLNSKRRPSKCESHQVGWILFTRDSTVTYINFL